MQRPIWILALAMLALPGAAAAQEKIKVGQILERTFQPSATGGNPVTCFEIELIKGQEYTVTVAAKGLKPSVAWMVGGCAGVGADRKTGATGKAQMIMMAKANTTWLTVESSDGAVGDFAMQVRQRPALLRELQTVQGRFDAAVVCYRVPSTAMWMVVRLTGTADARLAVFDNTNCAGKPVASDDDDTAGGGTDARVVYRQLTMKEHTIQVSRWGTDPARDYTLVFRTQMDPPADAKLKAP